MVAGWLYSNNFVGSNKAFFIHFLLFGDYGIAVIFPNISAQAKNNWRNWTYCFTKRLESHGFFNHHSENLQKLKIYPGMYYKYSITEHQGIANQHLVSCSANIYFCFLHRLLEIKWLHLGDQMQARIKRHYSGNAFLYGLHLVAKMCSLDL